MARCPPPPLAPALPTTAAATPQLPQLPSGAPTLRSAHAPGRPGQSLAELQWALTANLDLGGEEEPFAFEAERPQNFVIEYAHVDGCKYTNCRAGFTNSECWL
jgi:hypothetical protein